MEQDFFMQQALEEAKKAREIGEVPIGAVVVLDGEIIGR
ncbi:TPA: tRNA-specific adenosine deaminase, partial [Listeria innocua]|nr:tRNA-specific adenosine deaminase [Listeria innocua]